MSSVLVLWSGGVDSTVLLKEALDRGRLAMALHVNYGQPAAGAEAKACRQLGNSWEVPWRRILVDLEGSMAEGVGAAGPRVLAGRNQVLISHAVNIAAARGIDEVWLGAHHGDTADYPDCRPEFIGAMDELAKAWGVRVAAPLMDLTRSQVIARASAALVPLNKCWSCYQPRGIEPCGTCNSCLQ